MRKGSRMTRITANPRVHLDFVSLHLGQLSLRDNTASGTFDAEARIRFTTSRSSSNLPIIAQKKLLGSKLPEAFCMRLLANIISLQNYHSLIIATKTGFVTNVLLTKIVQYVFTTLCIYKLAPSHEGAFLMLCFLKFTLFCKRN